MGEELGIWDLVVRIYYEKNMKEYWENMKEYEEKSATQPETKRTYVVRLHKSPGKL